MAKSNLKSLKSTITIIIVIGLVLAGLIWLGISMLKGGGETINVQGSYTTTLAPDKVWMSVGTDTQAKTASDAAAQNTEITNKIYFALINLGLNSSDYQTEVYSVNPNYDYNSGNGNTITGYTVSHRIRIDTDKLSLTSPILDAVVSAGANSIYGVNFDLKDNTRESAKADALKKATESARTKAEAMASGLGAKLGKIKSISDSSVNYYPYMYGAVTASGVASKGAESIITQPGTVQVSADVNIVYETG